MFIIHVDLSPWTARASFSLHELGGLRWAADTTSSSSQSLLLLPLFFILFQSCSLYGGLRGVLDYGVLGYNILENLRAALRHHFTSSPLPWTPWSDRSGAQKEYDKPDCSEDCHEWDDVPAEAPLRENIFMVETAAIGPVAMWRHSGHLERFQDEAVQCTDTGSFFR